MAVDLFLKALKSDAGQMTVELAIALPVLIIVAVISFNTLRFFSICASFDRVAHETIRVQAAAPAYGVSNDQCCSLAERSLKQAYSDQDNIQVSVSCSASALGYQEFAATVDFAPSLFGLRLKDEVFGIHLPHLQHTTHLVIDTYRAGVFV